MNKSHRLKTRRIMLLAAAILLINQPSMAHDPVFGLGPHTLFKGGVEIGIAANRQKSADENDNEVELEAKFGVTGDWVLGLAQPFARNTLGGGLESGRGPTELMTKYRFWRNDLFAAQTSAAVSGRVIINNGDRQKRLKTNDYLIGLSYGYEGRKWYRWASARHRINSALLNGAPRPDLWRIDLVGGIRFVPTEYLQPDWVWMLELNAERREAISSSIGGDQLFLSPGLMWTYRNFALKSGVQLPVHDTLRANNQASDYRLQFELEWHI